MNVTLEAVSKTYSGTNGSVPALAPLTLDVHTGDFVCIIGPSGCGKSTLLRLIADQIPPTTGRIVLDGMPPSHARACKAIGWMAQRPALMPWSTVLDNMRLPLRVNRAYGTPPLSPRELLAMVDLEEFTDAYPSTLSGGMQQRVALAQTLVIGASLWLMDEPFAALDELTREALANDVLRLWRHFRPTVLWVTHNITEAARLADQVVVLTPRPGRLRAIIDVPLPRPRDATDASVIEIVRELRTLLRVSS